MNKYFGCALLFLFVGMCFPDSNQLPVPEPLSRAHAHNDYEHERPLYDALGHGFTSIEADVILKHDSLYVAHDPELIEEGQTLQSLYLAPLFKLCREHAGRVYPDWPTVYLMIDFKSDADSTYRLLQPLLDQYAEMLTRWRDGRKETRAVTVIVSGNRPIAATQNESFRLIGIDGRPDDLSKNVSSSLYPWISDDWTNLFDWHGRGDMPATEKAKLAFIVAQAHAHGQLVRFWSTDSPFPPERQNMWTTLTQAGVDLINTDDLDGLAEFLRRRGNAIKTQ